MFKKIEERNEPRLVSCDRVEGKKCSHSKYLLEKHHIISIFKANYN